MMNSRELDDGFWHDVQVMQNIDSFTLIVDDKKVTRYLYEILVLPTVCALQWITHYEWLGQ